jgi:hypothetical protein
MTFDEIKEGDYLVCTCDFGITRVGDVVKVAHVDSHAFMIVFYNTVYTRNPYNAEYYDKASSLEIELA